MESILETIKKLIGPSAQYSIFEPDLVTHINTVLFTLYQLGALTESFYISNDSETWDDIPTTKDVEAIKTYIYLKCKMYFDPPTNSALISAINEQIKELEWRVNVEVDPE